MTTRLDAAQGDDQDRLEVELGSDDPLGQLRGLRAATRQLDAWQREAIARAREDGASWSDIGDALGVTKQAAWSSYNQDVRDALAAARSRSGLSDEEAQQLTWVGGLPVVRGRRVPHAGRRAAPGGDPREHTGPQGRLPRRAVPRGRR